MDKKKIIILLPNLNFGGAEKVSLNLATELKKNGLEVKLVLMNFVGDYLKEAQEKFEVVDLKCDRTYKLPFLLKRYIKKNNPDVIISNFWKLNLCASINKIINKKFKLLLWEHSPPSLEKMSPTWQYKILSSILYRYADYIVAVSNGVREDIIKVTWGLKKKIITIYNPIEPPKQEILNRKIKNKIPRLIYVGRLTEAKNIKFLLESYALTLDIKKSTLLIVGEGELKEELMILTKKLNLEKYVKFYGFSNNVYELMSNADLVVLSSDYEGFGNVLVEGLYCGLKIVSTDCNNGPREILENGKFGSLVPLNDHEAYAKAIIFEINNPRNKEEQIIRAKEFLPSRIAMKFYSLM